MSDTRSGALTEVAALFASAGVPARLGPEAIARLGPAAAARLRDDPWRLLCLPGVRPDQADFFARRLLGPQIGPDDPRRGAGLAVHLLLRAAGDGHTVMPANALLSALEALEAGDAVGAVRSAIETGELRAVMDEPGETELLGLAPIVSAEETIAEGLARLTATADPLPLADGMPQAVGENGVSVLAGAPDAVEGVIRALAGGPGVIVAAATDRAARALGGRAGAAAGDTAGGALSLHRLLEPGEQGYARGEDLPVEADLVVVAGADTLDVGHAAALVEACMDGTHLLLTGDPGAPDPAGPGRFLADVTASGAVPVIEPAPVPDGTIGTLTGAVREGTLLPVRSAGREVVIVPAADAREAAHRVVQLVTDSIPRALGIPADDVLVVTPARRGEAGADALNRVLKERLNPGSGRYDPGDRVVTVTDLPCAAAGEFGTVTATPGADAVTGTIGVAFPSGTTAVPHSSLRHGWAVTVRRAQGTRWPAVVAVLPGEAAGMLSRPLVVGAFSRATRHLSVVHAAGPELARAVRERTEPVRRTRLAALLRESMAEV